MTRIIRRVLRTSGWAVLFLLTAASVTYGQVSDTTPPQIVSLDITPRDIDVTAAPAAVMVTLRVTDDRSGVKEFVSGVNWWIDGEFTSSTGDISAGRFFVRIAGDPLDGIYRAFFPFPQFIDSGDWQFRIAAIQDNALNRVAVSAAALQGQGFDTHVSVVSTPDDQAPQLTGISFSPGLLDVSAADQPLTVSLAVEDDLSGVELFRTFVEFVVTLRSPSGAQLRRIVNRELMLDSGTPLEGTWTATINFPRFSEAGIWRVNSVILYDNVGNRANLNAAALQALGVTTTLGVVSTPADRMAPRLEGFSFSPAFIDTSVGPQQVTVSAQISDDLAGVTFERDSQLFSDIFGAVLVSPSGGQRIPNSYLLVPPFNLTSGSPQSGTFEATYIVPQFAEAGVWDINLRIKDRVRNVDNYTPDRLNAMGFAGRFTVVKPSLEPDGTIDASGGTVTDSVFGDRASIEFPAGVLAAPTQVAIDVFSSPLDLETPSGYSAPGTMFVNISLTPQPIFPLPPPGLMVVLPLTAPMPPNDRIDLFRVDPASGMLVPALDVLGQPAVGVVDPDGLSATFLGVSRLSVVVGLIPATLPIAIDIKPGSATNPIQPRSFGVTPVAILSSATFNAPLTINYESLTFGRTGNETSLAFCNGGADDVNSDGHFDLVCHFYTAVTAFQSGDTQGTLKGKTIDNLKIHGDDVVRILR